VYVSGPGEFSTRLTGIGRGHHRFRPLSGTQAIGAVAEGCGEATVSFSVPGTVRARIRRDHFAYVRVRIAFTPVGGTTYTRTLTTRLFPPRE
jgi:hypothetical protein